MSDPENAADTLSWPHEPVSDPNAIRSEYRALAADYDAALEAWDVRPVRDGARIFAEHAPESAVVLDAGCGTGLSGQGLRERGFSRLVGIDLSPEMLDIARDKGVYEALEIADLTRPLQFAADRFDAVYCIGVLTHIRDVEALMRELCRVTRPGGVVFFSHRTDLFERRACAGELDRLVAAGVWTPVFVSEPHLCLPGHPDYADRVKVRYHVYRVCAAREGRS